MYLRKWQTQQQETRCWASNRSTEANCAKIMTVFGTRLTRFALTWHIDQRLLDDKYIWPIMDNAIYKKGFMEHHAYCARTILPPTIWYYGVLKTLMGIFMKTEIGIAVSWTSLWRCKKRWVPRCEMVYVLDM